MNPSMTTILLSALMLCSSSFFVHAFVVPPPSTTPARSVTFRPATKITGAKPPSSMVYSSVFKSTTSLHMADEEKEAAPTDVAPVAPTSGTFYDDQVDPTPNKPQLSNAMRERLMREASTGLDSEQKQTNVILYIMAAVGALVILGGQGILY